MANAKKATLFVGVVALLYAIIAYPIGSADLVETGFVGISDAAKAVGRFIGDLAAD